MSLAEHKDRVKDQTSTTGTSSFVLNGIAPLGYRTVATAHTAGAIVRYLCISSSMTDWEVGEGVFDGVNTITRATIFASSNSNNIVTFGIGTKTILTGPTAKDSDGTLELSQIQAAVLSF